MVRQVVRSLLAVGIVGMASASVDAETFVSAPLTDASNAYASGIGVSGYTDTAAALGKPGAVVGAGSGFDAVLNPFNPHYETSELTGIGLGGRVAYRFAQPLTTSVSNQIGVYTGEGFADADYPNGSTGTKTATFSSTAGAERTAVVEVADSSGAWKSLGRVLFDIPANYYTNATSPTDLVIQNPTPADFSKPFTGTLSSFDNESFSQVLTTLNGSAGGTWLNLPQSLGLSQVEFIRFSDPKWQRLSDGALVDTFNVFGTDTSAALYLNGISANSLAVTPEPASIALLLGSLLIFSKRR